MGENRGARVVWLVARRVAGQRMAPAPRRRRREGGKNRGRRERWSEGSLVNKLKFKIKFVNLVFLLFLDLK